MGISVKDLENVGKNIERALDQRSEKRAEELLQQHGLFYLMGVLAFAPIRIGLFLGGLGASFAVGAIFINKIVGGVGTIDNLVISGGLTAGLYWFFVMRKFPLLAPLPPIAIILWVLTHGGI